MIAELSFSFLVIVVLRPAFLVKVLRVCLESDVDVKKHNRPESLMHANKVWNVVYVFMIMHL